MSVEFESPATRVIEQFSGKKESEFRIPTDLPDLTFLRRLSIQGRLLFEQKRSSATEDAITRTPAAGTTEFYYKIIASTQGTGSFTYSFINDGQTRFVVFTNLNSGILDTHFMDSLVGNGTKTMIINANEAGTATGDLSLFGWTENTSRIRDVSI